MRILHIITTTSVGGAERMLQKLILNSRETLHHSVLSIKPIGSVGQELIDAGVKVYSLNMDSAFSFSWNFRKIKQVIQTDNIQLVQTWLYHSDLMGSIIGMFFRLPVVWNIRSTTFGATDPFSTRVVMHLCAALSYISPAKIISGAQASVTQHKKYWYNYKKMTVISNGFTAVNEIPVPETIRALKKGLNIQETDIVIGAIGRYHPIKAYDMLLKAAKELSNDLSNLKVIIVGRDMDRSNAELAGMIRALQLENRIILVGEQMDIHPYLSIMDAFCLTSLSEGFPNVLAEAMLMGTPSFSTKCGDAAAILNDDKFVVDIGDYRAFAEALRQFFKLSKVERERLGQKQRANILENYSLEKAVNKYTEVYKQILNKA